MPNRCRPLGLRTVVPAALAVGASLVLVGCGSDDSDVSADSAAVAATGSAVTTTAVVTGDVVPDTVATTAAQSSNSTPAASSPPTTVAAPVTSAAGHTGGYAATDQSYVGPDVATAADVGIEPVADGVYRSWSYRLGDDGATVVFDLSLADGSTTELLMPIGSGTVSILHVDGIDAPEAFAVDAAELARLLAGDAPAADAPAGFVADLVDPFIVTVRDGVVVAADQKWAS